MDFSDRCISSISQSNSTSSQNSNYSSTDMKNQNEDLTFGNLKSLLSNCIMENNLPKNSENASRISPYNEKNENLVEKAAKKVDAKIKAKEVSKTLGFLQDVINDYKSSEEQAMCWNQSEREMCDKMIKCSFESSLQIANCLEDIIDSKFEEMPVFQNSLNVLNLKKMSNEYFNQVSLQKIKSKPFNICFESVRKKVTQISPHLLEQLEKRLTRDKRRLGTAFVSVKRDIVDSKHINDASPNVIYFSTNTSYLFFINLI